MTASVGDIIRRLGTVIGELDRVSMRTTAVQLDAGRAHECFVNAGVGSRHPYLETAKREAQTAAEKAGRVARLLAEAATALTTYAEHIAPGALASHASSPPTGLPSGDEVIKPDVRGPAFRNLTRRLGFTPNSDDGMAGLRTLGNNAHDAARPGGHMVPRSPQPSYQAADTDRPKAGDVLIAAFVVALVGARAVEVLARLRRKARSRDPESGWTRTVDE